MGESSYGEGQSGLASAHSHERLDHLLPDISGPFGAGEHADEKRLSFVQVVDLGGATAFPAGVLGRLPNTPVAAQFVEVRTDQVLADIGSCLHAQAFGQIGVEDAGFFVDDVEFETPVHNFEAVCLLT